MCVHLEFSRRAGLCDRGQPSTGSSGWKGPVVVSKSSLDTWSSTAKTGQLWHCTVKSWTLQGSPQFTPDATSLLYQVPNFQRFSVHSHEPLQGWCYCGNNVSPCAMDLWGVTANLQSYPDILPGPANKNLCTFPVVHSCETQKQANLHVVSTALNTISSALCIFISPSNANNSRLVSQGQIKQAFCTWG